MLNYLISIISSTLLEQSSSKHSVCVLEARLYDVGIHLLSESVMAHVLLKQFNKRISYFLDQPVAVEDAPAEHNHLRTHRECQVNCQLRKVVGF